MSYAYYVDKNGKVTKNKKKKKQTEFLYTVDDKGKVTKNNITEDIAPVKSTTKKTKGGNKNSIFKSGGFSDGVDSVGDFFVDLGQSVVGTVGDVGVGVGKGLTRFGEGIGDAVRYGIAGVADATGNDDYAKRLRKSAKEDDTNDIWKKAEKKVDNWSVLGNKADAVSEGIGYIAGTILTAGIAGGAGATAKVATAITRGVQGVSALGSGMSEAYQSGATDKQAYTYGTIAGTGEVISDMIFGGLGKTVNVLGMSKGLSSADDMLAKKVSGMFNNQIAKNFAEYGIKAGAEGTEEVLSGIVSAVGKKVTYMEEEELQNILKDENLLEQFVVGSITSGIAQSGVVPGMKSGSLIEANKQNKDFITGRTVSEQSLIDSLVEEQTAQKNKEKAIEDNVKKIIEEREEAQGGVLSEKNKQALRKTVMDKIDSGEIDISSSKLSNKEISVITKEIEQSLEDGTYELSKIEDVLTSEQTKQIKELEEKLKTTKDKTEISNIQKQLSELKNAKLSELQSMTKNNRYLNNAIYEKQQSQKAYEYDDANVTDEYEKATRESAKTHLNNSKESRKLVDIMSKLAKDRQINYRFTNQQELKEQGDLIEDQNLTAEEKTKINNLEKQLKDATTKEEKQYIQNQIDKIKYLDIGGFVRKNADGVETVIINAESSQSINSVVGHETKHLLEKNKELNKEFDKLLFDYAKSKGDYDVIRKRIEKTYEGIDNVNLDSELSAELTGRYLFTDDKFIESLINDNKNPKKQTIVQKIKELIDDLVVRFKGTEQEKQLRQVQKKFKELYNQNEDSKVSSKENAYKQTTSKNNDTKYSFSGTRAKTANSSLLLRAEHMLDTGVDSETVRKETGWFKGYDGKMRFEIDDSQMKVYQNGDAVFSKSHPEYAELQELKKKKENSGITAEELSRLEELDKTWGNETERLNDLLRSGNLKLKHILEHDKLYENYPELKDMDIKIARSEEIGNGVRGSYNPSKKSITINEKLLGGDTSEVKKTLIHEIQHAIQDIEGFTSGSSEEYWQDRLDSGESIKTSEQKAKLQKLKKEYEDISKNEPEFFKEMNELEEMTPTVSRGAIDWDTLEKIEEDPIEWQNFDKKRDSLSEKYGEIKVYDFMDLQYEIKELERKSITASDAYYKTAGEIEARDTANRLSLNEEQRKATRPDIDKEDVVYSDNAKYSLSDSDGKTLTKEQQEYFKDSKVRDENGNLKVMYHGSRSGGFTVFDPKASDDNRSFFFSDKPSVASSYSDSENEIAPTGKEETKGLYKTYLNLENPYIV